MAILNFNVIRMALHFYYKLEAEQTLDLKLPNNTKFLLTPHEAFTHRQRHWKGRDSSVFPSPVTFSNSSSLLDLLTPSSLTPLSPRSSSLGASFESGAEVLDEPQTPDPLNFLGVCSEGIGLSSVTANSPHVELFPIPLPKTQLKNFDLLTKAKISACCLLGENQIWLGTESGSLHILSLIPEDISVLSHHSLQLIKPVTAFACRPVRQGAGRGDGLLMRYVYVALESGCILEFSGVAGVSGGMKNPIERGNKYIYIVKTMSDINIHCLAYHQQTDLIWVGLTRKINIIEQSDNGYKDHSSLAVDVDSQLSAESYVSAIMHTETGTWTSFTHSPFILLWDSVSLQRKCCISLCNLSFDLDITEETTISRIAFNQNFVLLATKRGHLVVYRPLDPTDPESPWEYTASIHCGEGEITDMHVQSTGLQEDSDTDLVNMNIYVCLYNSENLLNSSLVTLNFRKLKNRPISKRLSGLDIRERYQASEASSLDPISTHSKPPKLSLIGFNERNTVSFLPLLENKTV